MGIVLKFGLKRVPRDPFEAKFYVYAFELHAVCKTYFGTFKTMFQLTHRLLVPFLHRAQMRLQQNGQNRVKIGQIGVTLDQNGSNFGLNGSRWVPNGSAWAKMGRNRVKMGQNR